MPRGKRHVDGGAEAAAAAGVVGEAGARVLRPLVRRGVEDVRLLVEDGLGAVAVVHVPVEDGDALAGGVQHRGGDGDVVDEAEAHGAVARGVMAGRAHEGGAVVELTGRRP